MGRYQVVQTKTVYIDAPNAAAARKLVESLLQLNPTSKMITTQVHVEKMER